MHKQLYYPITDLFAEAEEKAAYRAKSATVVQEGLTPELLFISEEDHSMLHEYVREAADEIYTRIQTLLRSGRAPYEFIEDDRVVYNLELPQGFNQDHLPVLYNTVKNYLVEGVLKGFYSERGYEKGMQISHLKMDDLYRKIQYIRVCRPVKRKGKMI